MAHQSAFSYSSSGTEPSISPQSSGINTPLERPNPFGTPTMSSRNSWTSDSRCHSAAGAYLQSPEVDPRGLSNRYFRSRRVRKDQMESPKSLRNHKKKSIFQRQSWLIPCLGIFVGVGITGVLIYLGLQDQKHAGKFCPVFMEDFSSGELSPNIWTAEQQVGGYGNGEFEQTTDDPDVLFVKNGMLHIKPKLQDENLVAVDNSTIDLGASCTGTGWSSCFAFTNTTNGTIVPPVKSARINTKKGASIRYGRVEVTAKMPKGDWLWPAIWMLPTDEVYGSWPASGEIDIMETRGNNHTYKAGPGGGNNLLTSALHWGPEHKLDKYLQTVNQLPALHEYYGDSFHTFGLEWTEDYIFTYVDSVLLQVLYVPLNKRFWDKGHFPAATVNGTALADPWSHTGRLSTPFDQKFYLILNVAVGGTNGYFRDNEAGKPWADASPVARKEFWQARDQWLPTWQKSGEMQVKSVKMWEQC
ncbi:putative glycoside hydrolase family 16, concanavalin A-like lectin/glucanase domain superfamily [Septoria linicola]|nr:putative glycoside hydrolase family 16, concanavalin A-like lectin/glucanase domain superfamily [Septoria linicola]